MKNKLVKINDPMIKEAITMDEIIEWVKKHPYASVMILGGLLSAAGVAKGSYKHLKDLYNYYKDKRKGEPQTEQIETPSFRPTAPTPQPNVEDPERYQRFTQPEMYDLYNPRTSSLDIYMDRKANIAAAAQGALMWIKSNPWAIQLIIGLLANIKKGKIDESDINDENVDEKDKSTIKNIVNLILNPETQNIISEILPDFAPAANQGSVTAMTKEASYIQVIQKAIAWLIKNPWAIDIVVRLIKSRSKQADVDDIEIEGVDSKDKNTIERIVDLLLDHNTQDTINLLIDGLRDFQSSPKSITYASKNGTTIQNRLKSLDAIVDAMEDNESDIELASAAAIIARRLLDDLEAISEGKEIDEEIDELDEPVMVPPIPYQSAQKIASIASRLDAMNMTPITEIMDTSLVLASRINKNFIKKSQTNNLDDVFEVKQIFNDHIATGEPLTFAEVASIINFGLAKPNDFQYINNNVFRYIGEDYNIDEEEIIPIEDDITPLEENFENLDPGITTAGIKKAQRNPIVLTHEILSNLGWKPGRPIVLTNEFLNNIKWTPGTPIVLKNKDNDTITITNELLKETGWTPGNAIRLTEKDLINMNKADWTYGDIDISFYDEDDEEESRVVPSPIEQKKDEDIDIIFYDEKEDKSRTVSSPHEKENIDITLQDEESSDEHIFSSEWWKRPENEYDKAKGMGLRQWLFDRFQKDKTTPKNDEDLTRDASSKKFIRQSRCNDTELKALEIINKENGIQPKLLASKMNISNATVYRVLKSLRNKDLIQKTTKSLKNKKGTISKYALWNTNEKSIKLLKNKMNKTSSKWDWMQLTGATAETNELNRSKIDHMVEKWMEEYDLGVIDKKFNIIVNKSDETVLYKDIPWSILEKISLDGNINMLKMYQEEL